MPRCRVRYLEFMMRTAKVAMLVAFSLLGCATPAQRAMEKANEAEQMLQVYGPACERIGYAANTDPWRNCVVQMNQTDALRYLYGYSYPYSRLGPYW